MMPPLLDRLHLIVKFKLFVGLLYFRKRAYTLLNPAFERDHEMVNVGGGLFFRPHWKVLDHVSPFYPFGSRFIDYDVDLLDGGRFPHADNSVSVFYSSHTLEHIPQEACQHVIDEMYRCLKSGGIVRLTMPDYDLLRRAVDEDDRSFFKVQIASGLTLEEGVIDQIATDMVGKETAVQVRQNYRTMTPDEFAEHYCSRASRDAQRTEGGNHINWFNYEKLSAMMREAGFTQICRSAPQKSRCRHLVGKGGVLALGNMLDGERRLGIDTSHPERSLYVEAVK